MTPLLLAAILAGLVAVAPFAIDTYLPALPMMAGDLDASIALVPASIPAYLIGGAIGQFVGGPLSDQIGRKPVGLFGLTVYGLSSCAIAFTNSVEMLLLLRFTQALGGGSTTVIVAAIVRDSQDGKSAARMMALIGLMLGSLRVLWPWPDGVDSTVLGAPDKATGTAVALAVVGFAVVVAIDWIARRTGTTDHDEEVAELQS